MKTIVYIFLFLSLKVTAQIKKDSLNFFIESFSGIQRTSFQLDYAPNLLIQDHSQNKNYWSNMYGVRVGMIPSKRIFLYASGSFNRLRFVSIGGKVQEPAAKESIILDLFVYTPGMGIGYITCFHKIYNELSIQVNHSVATGHSDFSRQFTYTTIGLQTLIGFRIKRHVFGFSPFFNYSTYKGRFKIKDWPNETRAYLFNSYGVGLTYKLLFKSL